MFVKVFENFVSFRRIPMRVVIVTALASYVLQIGAITMGQPLYIIALYTLLPWIPLALFEGLWKYEHYNWIAVFAVVTALQVGHIGEHTAQVVQLAALNGTISCPPPVDNEENTRRAMEAGIRQSNQLATGISSSVVIQPDGRASPRARLDASGRESTGPPACGVFGQLDFETVHLVWDSLVWLGALWLLIRFPFNIWLWVAVFAASAHEMEHLFLGYIFFADTMQGFNYLRQLWATTAQGNIVTAHPVAVRPELVTFYEAGGSAGLMGRNGLVETLIGSSGTFPIRPYLHLGYNSLVVIPTVIAFLTQSRKVYDQYLARALPRLTEEQLIAATPRLERLRFPAGEIIVRQGAPADKFYIVTVGQVEVLREEADGTEIAVTRLGVGQYFGEIGLLHGGARVATVRAAGDVEVLALDREGFSGLMDDSEVSKDEIDRIVRQRVQQLRALQSVR